MRKKIRESGLDEDYTNFSKCRKDFKNLIKENLVANFADEDDPALIPKKYWSYVKSATKSTRIPSTINYHGRFRNNPADQAEIFNEYFEDQFFNESIYDINIEYSNDSVNDIDFSISKIRKILKK